MITLDDIKTHVSIIGDRCHKLKRPPLILTDMRMPVQVNGGVAFMALTIDVPDDAAAAAELVLDQMKFNDDNAVAFYQLYTVGSQMKLRFGSFKY